MVLNLQFHYIRVVFVIIFEPCVDLSPEVWALGAVFPIPLGSDITWMKNILHISHSGSQRTWLIVAYAYFSAMYLQCINGADKTHLKQTFNPSKWMRSFVNVGDQRPLFFKQVLKIMNLLSNTLKVTADAMVSRRKRRRKHSSLHLQKLDYKVL